MTSDECCTSERNRASFCAHRGLGEKSDILADREELPYHHEDRDQQRTDREAADRLGPGLENRDEEERVGRRDGEVGQAGSPAASAAGAALVGCTPGTGRL